MSALFSFSSFFRLLILLVCTCTFLHRKFPSLFTKREGMLSCFYKCHVIGTRLSPYIALICLMFAAQKFIQFLI